MTHLYGQVPTNYGANSGTEGRFSVYVGENSGQNSTHPNSHANTFVGYQAGRNNVSGHTNTFIGSEAGLNLTDGEHNIFVGNGAGKSAQNSVRNIVIGTAAAMYIEGFDNTIVGINSARNISTGQANTFLGLNSGFNTTTGYSNVYVGKSSGINNITGSYNISIGNSSGEKNKTGNSNINIGHYSGYQNLGHNNIFLGYESGFNETGSNKLYIENSRSDIPLIYGDFSADKVGINTKEIPSGYTLAVSGKTITEEVKVQLKSAWPDYVFKKEYNLPDLGFVENFVNHNGHLPEVPSKQEVEENKGVELGEMNTVLLKKIEELTLYLIEEHKTNKALSKRIETLEKMIKLK